MIGAPIGVAAFAAGASALSWWQAQLSRDSPGAHWGVALLVVGAVVGAIAVGWRRQRLTARAWISRNAELLRAWRSQPLPVVLSIVVWFIVISGVVGWDLVSFIVQSHTLPTLSYFIGHVTRYRIGRGVVFALWLGVGAYIVAGYRAEAPR